MGANLILAKRLKSNLAHLAVHMIWQFVTSGITCVPASRGYSSVPPVQVYLANWALATNPQRPSIMV